MVRPMIGSVRVETMNAGTAEEFDRVFIECSAGHSLGSIAVKNLLRYPFEFDKCTHYACKEEG